MKYIISTPLSDISIEADSENDARKKFLACIGKDRLPKGTKIRHWSVCSVQEPVLGADEVRTVQPVQPVQPETLENEAKKERFEDFQAMQSSALRAKNFLVEEAEKNPESTKAFSRAKLWEMFSGFNSMAITPANAARKERLQTYFLLEIGIYVENEILRFRPGQGGGLLGAKAATQQDKKAQLEREKLRAEVFAEAKAAARAELELEYKKSA